LQMAGIGLLAIPAFATAAGNRNKKIKRPPYLQPGNTIGITCPAGFSLLETIQPSIDLIQSWGFKVQLGTTIGKMDHTFGGTDAEIWCCKNGRLIKLSIIQAKPQVGHWFQ